MTVTGSVSGSDVTAPADVTLTITDDDAPDWAVTVDPAAIAEDGGTSTVTVSTGGVTFNDNRTIRLSFGGDATPGSDYQVEDAGGATLASPYELTLAAGDSAVTATIRALDDLVDDDAEQIEVTASHGDAVIGDQPTVTITDDEGAPTVTLVLSPDEITEDGGQSAVTATVAPAAAAAFTVTVAAQAEDPATAADFALSDDTTLSFVAGVTESSGTVLVTAVNNTADEPDKTVTVSGTVSAAGVTAPAEVTLTIIDDDAPDWAVTVDPAAIVEAGGTATVRVSTGGGTFADDRSILLSFDGDATPGTDYTVADADGTALSLPYELTLAAGASAVTAAITALDDEENDNAEQILVTARHEGEEIGEQQTVTIIDDEPDWTVTVDPAAIVEAGGTATVTVSTGGVTVADPQEIALPLEGTATAGSDYTVTDAGGNELTSPFVLELAADESAVTATITALDDEDYEDAEEIVITAFHRDESIGDRPTVTITDDERTPEPTPEPQPEPQPVVTLMVSPDEISENGGVSRVQATVSPPSGSAFALTVSPAPDGRSRWRRRPRRSCGRGRKTSP